MHLTNTITALCGATVLSLSLISCNKKDVAVKSTPPIKSWGVSEPVILSVDGHETNYGEVNTKANTSYSIDDRLVIKDLAGASELRFRTSCARGEERVQYADKFQVQNEFSLNEFLPQELFYSTHGEPFKQVTCALEITILNAQGSRQTFPSLNLVMNDISANKLELRYKMHSLANDKMEIVPSAELEKVALPAIASDENLNFRCETLSAVSTDKYVRNLTDLKIVSGNVTGNEQKPQICRVLKLKGASVKAVSPFFVIQFFDSTGILGANDNNLIIGGDTYPERIHRPIFRRQTLFNPHAAEIFLRLPKYVALDAVTRHTVGTYLWSPTFKLNIAGGRLIAQNDLTFTIALKSHESAMVSYVLDADSTCVYPIKSISVKTKNNLVAIESTDSKGEIIFASWNLINEDFSPYISAFDVHHNPDSDVVMPNSCLVH